MATQEIQLNKQFSNGSFMIHNDTLCMTVPEERGWLRDSPGCVRRHYRATAAAKKTRVNAVEAIARSLMTHDTASPGEKLVMRLIYQYYALNYEADSGVTVDLFQKMYLDKTYHPRGRFACAVREDCHNPFHRLLAPPHGSALVQYRRFITLVQTRSLTAVMDDPHAHLRLNMNKEQLKRCVDTYFDTIADEVGL